MVLAWVRAVEMERFVTLHNRGDIPKTDSGFQLGRTEQGEVLTIATMFKRHNDLNWDVLSPSRGSWWEEPYPCVVLGSVQAEESQSLILPSCGFSWRLCYLCLPAFPLSSFVHTVSPLLRFSLLLTARSLSTFIFPQFSSSVQVPLLFHEPGSFPKASSSLFVANSHFSLSVYSAFL